ncbi:hypothetical protein F5Y18DRAFT_302296 [Xylariaceae sp. FL1019]|nr:hypothetical protein F5Y18DRAFT_302296 [Xylariaceae sp. FL1019]
MPNQLGPPAAVTVDDDDDNDNKHENKDANPLLLSRSPHPYSRQRADLLEPSSALPPRNTTPPSDSGTEADDEHFLKGLPAPQRLHKGLRGRNERLSGLSTPLLTPGGGSTDQHPDPQPFFSLARPDSTSSVHAAVAAAQLYKRRRTKEILRRLTELLVIGLLTLFVATNPRVRPLWAASSPELSVFIALVVALVLLYPLRLVLWAHRHRTLSTALPITIPSSFEPAPLLYPPAITILVSYLIAVDNPAVVLPNIVLALCSLPPALVPSLSTASPDSNILHWALSCLPLTVSHVLGRYVVVRTEGSGLRCAPLAMQDAVFLYPLHCSLVQVLHQLTTTSLLTAELQLLSIGLVNILLLSSSPQATILKAMLWVGGLDILVSCTKPVQWGIVIARVPKWRFKRPSIPVARAQPWVPTLMTWRRMRHGFLRRPLDSSCSSPEAIDDHDSDDSGATMPNHIDQAKGPATDVPAAAEKPAARSLSGVDGLSEILTEIVPVRRHTLPGGGTHRKLPTHTPSGRKKRSASISMQAFLSLTHQQATVRKWMYASYVYVCIFATLFIPLPCIGVKTVVMQDALRGDEPVGWALGYLFGDLSWFRWQVVSRNLNGWILLPPRFRDDEGHALAHGWIEHARVSFLGEANTRLLISAYCILVITSGLLVVFSLSPLYEVDTRRKVFHFMMVAMFLPATYIDPPFVALALSIILAAFLLLDLLRASQLPPLSKPLASFLTPYVDGRDLKGPVVISHIFLLVGCAIPLWLSLGSLPRTGQGHLQGWSVPSREISMVSGIVCVGLGDAAASLIGRRYGHRKWVWGGGKSLEGSVAFAVAVFLGLMAADAWLRFGGWSTTEQQVDTWQTTARKTTVCASVASITEAVLTGGNDNVVVPVVLWACVKSVGV